jgi:hypothetical protein
MRALLALLVSTCLASAQEGPNNYYNDGWPAQDAQEGRPIISRHGIGHDTWHEVFYSKLVQDDGASCCNLNDCRPTVSRTVGDHYEVLVDGKWMKVPMNTIRKVVAPDRGAHVCAPIIDEFTLQPHILCVVLPPEG